MEEDPSGPLDETSGGVDKGATRARLAAVVEPRSRSRVEAAVFGDGAPRGRAWERRRRLQPVSGSGRTGVLVILNNFDSMRERAHNAGAIADEGDAG